MNQNPGLWKAPAIEESFAETAWMGVGVIGSVAGPLYGPGAV